MSSDTALPFAKYSGAGNDFIIVDARSSQAQETIQKLVPSGQRSELARLLCRRGLSIGADGMVFVKNGQGVDFEWDFYNSDGSEAEMCGNAARCVAHFSFQHKVTGREMSFRTRAGVVRAKILEGSQVEVAMREPKLVDKAVVAIVDSGVPHVVIEESDLKNVAALRQKAQTNRYPKALDTKGANITFFSKKEENRIQAMSFERGVEDFTLACGTGAIAAAFAWNIKNPNSKKVEVEMPGGKLEVEFNSGANQVLLRGSARPLLEGKILKEACDEEV